MAVSAVMTFCMMTSPASVGSAKFSLDPFDIEEGAAFGDASTAPPREEIPVNPKLSGVDESEIRIMIDPGHYGHYNHSPVYSPYWESVMTWKLSNYLMEDLRELGVHADLTREDPEVDMGLNERGFEAKGYDFFISMHSNAGAGSGMDQPLAFCYQDLPWTDMDDISQQLGKLLAEKVSDVMGTKQKGAIAKRKGTEDHDHNGVMDDEWYSVLFASRWVDTPGILLEHSYHTNYRSAVWLYNDDNLKKLAKEEAQVIYDYFIVLKPQQPPLEPLGDKKPGGIGDINGDNAVDSIDASYVLAEYAKTSTGKGEMNELQREASDVNFSGTVDSIDASVIMKYYAYTATGGKKTFEKYLEK